MDDNREALRRYYADSPEEVRLTGDDGWLERDRTIELVARHVPDGARLLDLGCGTGVYAAELIRRGYRVTLVDLSPELLDRALVHLSNANVEAEAVVLGDAARLDLSGTFDAVLCAGPLYHASNRDDLRRMLATCQRVLRRDGVLLGTFIPRATGVSGLIARAIDASQIGPGTLTHAWETGTFANHKPGAFTGAFFIDPDELRTDVEAAGFHIVGIESLRGIAAPYGPALTTLRTSHPAVFEEVLDLVRRTADRSDVIGMSWHAMVVAQRR